MRLYFASIRAFNSDIRLFLMTTFANVGFGVFQNCSTIFIS